MLQSALFSEFRKAGYESGRPEQLKMSCRRLQLKAAGYALYGSSTMLVYTTGHGVHSFTYDPTLGEFLLTKEHIIMPKKGKYYSTNEGNFYKWSENIQQYIQFIKTPAADNSKPYSLRYIGVADIHRTLLQAEFIFIQKIFQCRTGNCG